MDIFNKLNKEAQELLELFNNQLNELSSEGNTKVVEALTTMGHIMGKEVQILREENKLLLKCKCTAQTALGPINIHRG